jgi:hypothetical protein
MLKTLLIAFAILSYSANANIAQKLVDKSHEARGGADAIKAITSWDIKGISVNMMQNSNDNFELKFEGKSFYAKQAVNGSDNIFVYNGTEGWYLAPMMQVNELSPLPAQMVDQVRGSFENQILNTLKGLLIESEEKGLVYGFLGKEDLDGEQVSKISVKDPNEPEEGSAGVTCYISSKDNFMKKFSVASPQANIDYVFKEYTKFGTFTFPKLIEISMNSNVVAQIKITDLNVAPKFDATTFAKPKM